MLQTLLAERFHLRLHRETRLLPVYALVIEKNGSKLIADQKSCPKVQGRTRPIRTDPVIDETGLTGVSYCTADGESPLVANLLATDASHGPGSSIYTAVEEKWGMKLEPKKAPMDVLVIDSVERPSAN